MPEQRIRPPAMFVLTGSMVWQLAMAHKHEPPRVISIAGNGHIHSEMPTAKHSSFGMRRVDLSSDGSTQEASAGKVAGGGSSSLMRKSHHRFHQVSHGGVRASHIAWNNGVASHMLLHRAQQSIKQMHLDFDLPKGLQKAPRWMKSGLVPVLIAFVSVGCLLSTVIIVLFARGGQMDTPQAEGEGEAEGEDGGSGSSAEGAALTTVEKMFKRTPEGLDEDLYGMGIAALIRDSQRFAMKTELLHLRVSRLSIALLVLLFTMTMQVFLIFEMKVLVTSVSTKEAREAYDQYEVWMYGNDTSKMIVTENGYHRGKPENFDITRFDTLDDDLKSDVCQIPLSQPTFFMAVLIVWTLTVVAEIRRTMELAVSLTFATPTIPSMAEATEETPESGDEAVLVVGLTGMCKAIIMIFIIIPRLLVAIILLWLGCRWLTGTMGFSDVLQNAVTLEFILLLKNLLYDTMAPHHNKTETRNTLILPNSDEERPTVSVFLGAFLWGVIAIVWVVIYIEFVQRVLPDYQWDIHDACRDFLVGLQDNTAINDTIVELNGTSNATSAVASNASAAASNATKNKSFF
mmetsp:Transcript_118661/g.221788  ORF Transcript_118661/g.221788 Transcript_118661/m.221788 type:complete len:572 (-) Transcript_118661:80-1795(-)